MLGGQAVCISRGGQKPRLAVHDNLRNPAGSRRRDRHAERHRVEQHAPHPLLGGAQRRHARRGEQLVGVAPEAGQHDGLLETEAAHLGVHGRSKRTLAHQQCPQPRNASLYDTDGAHEGEGILVRHERRDLNDERHTLGDA